MNSLRGDSFASPLQEGHEVVTVEVHLEGLATDLIALHHLGDDIGLAGGGGEGGD